MSRNISSPMLAALQTNAVNLAILGVFTFKSATEYVWSGVGNLVYGGNTYKGIGSLGAIGRVTEGTDVHAYGTTVALSGIDSALLTETLTDVQLGAPATLSLALLDATGAIIGTPCMFFSGVVDKPSVAPGVDTFDISLALETKLANLSRGTSRRYTAADQNLYYPNDAFFNWVEMLNDLALHWAP